MVFVNDFGHDLLVVLIMKVTKPKTLSDLSHLYIYVHASESRSSLPIESTDSTIITVATYRFDKLHAFLLGRKTILTYQYTLP